MNTTDEHAAMEILDQIEARAEKATPGPWEERAIRGLGNSLGVDSVSEGFVCEVNRVRGKYKANATFIAASRTDGPVLVKIAKMWVKELTFHGRNKKLAEITAMLKKETP